MKPALRFEPRPTTAFRVEVVGEEGKELGLAAEPPQAQLPPHPLAEEEEEEEEEEETVRVCMGSEEGESMPVMRLSMPWSSTLLP